MAKKLFPSASWVVDANPVFTYTIVIGKRSTMDTHRDKILQYAEDSGVSIRSYDWLTAMFRLRRNSHFSNFMRDAKTVHGVDLPTDVRNALINPFSKALTEAKWRKLVKGLPGSLPHFFGSCGPALAQILSSNKKLDEFDKIWSNITSGEQADLMNAQ